MEINWNMFANKGIDAIKPIPKLVAPRCKAKPTRNIPLVRATIILAKTPSYIDRFRFLCIMSSIEYLSISQKKLKGNSDTKNQN